MLPTTLTRTLAILPIALVAAATFGLNSPAAPTAAGDPDATARPVPSGPVLKTTTLESGLILEELNLGDGHALGADDAYTANYHAVLKADGTVFDSTYDPAFKHQKPAILQGGGVIKGWHWGVQGMKVGGIRRIIIPADLAYGEAGAGPVPPNADLIYTIELTGVLQIEDTKAGDGEAMSNGSVAVTAFTMKDAAGTVIDQAQVARPYIWMPNEFSPIHYGLDGMKVGGKRRIIVPADMNILAEDATPAAPDATPTARRPQNVPITIEVELLGVRKLPPLQPSTDAC